LFIFYIFKTGVVPVYKPPQKIEPASKGVVPTGTFFKYPEEKLPFNFFLKKNLCRI
jgi:hypothetical protein